MNNKISTILLFGLLSSAAMAEELHFGDDNYFISKRYTSRAFYTHFDDTPLKDEFQDEIYAAAFNLAKATNCKSIGDIGCGSGYKLIKYFSNYETVGFEIEPTLTFLINTYPTRSWKLADFSKTPENKAFDLLICADVIEHLVDPDELLNWIQQLDFKYLVISTPEREKLATLWAGTKYELQNLMGPPSNSAHVREWNQAEFNKYISQYFEIIEHFNPEKEFYGQVIIAKKKQILRKT